METAWLEAQQGFAFKAQPLTMCCHEVDCADILDLTDQGTLDALGIGVSDLACGWAELSDRGKVPVTWLLADRLMAEGIAGILVPSFAYRAEREDRSLVFWPRGREQPHRIKVTDDFSRLTKGEQSLR